MRQANGVVRDSTLLVATQRKRRHARTQALCQSLKLRSPRTQRSLVACGAGSILPQSPAKYETRNTYYLAPWTPQTGLGDGYDRLRCTYKSNVVIGTPKEQKNLTAKDVTGDSKVIVDSSTYQEANSVSVSASGSAWGASASASGSIAAQASHSSRAVTALINFQWLADPFTAFDVSEAGNDVMLQPTARQFLQENGPVAFHEEYGSHCVIGYRYGVFLAAPLPSCGWHGHM